MNTNLLALDLGTSSINCMITDQHGSPLGLAEASMSYFTPRDFSNLACEFNLPNIMSTIDRLISSVLRNSKVDPSSILAIGITSQRQGLVFLDQNGAEIISSPNIDVRAIFQGTSMDETFGEEIYETTGHRPSLLLAPARLEWLKQSQPAKYAKVSKLVTLGGWLAFRLTGNISCEPSLAAGSGLLNIRNGNTCADLLEKLNVDTKILPPLINAGDIVGTLTTAASHKWSFKNKIPVTLAGADTQCGLLGMGLTSVAETGVISGWSCSLQTITKHPCKDIDKNIWVGFYPIENRWVAESNLGDFGNAYKWLKEVLLGKRVPWEKIESLIEMVPPGSDGVFSFIGPGDSPATKIQLGIGSLVFPTPIRFQRPKKEQFLRASIETLAYSLKINFEGIQEMTGLKTRTLHIGGGMTRNHAIPQIIADVFGCEVKRSKLPEVSVRGAAIAAAAAGGLYSSVEEAAKSSTKFWDSIEPNRGISLEYLDYFEEWKQLYGKLLNKKVEFE